MAITPQTELRLLKVNINIDERNQLTFSNATAQYNYFNSLPSLDVDNFTYQRADGVIRYPAHIDNIITYNYCMYQNENYTNKWFYAFITDMRYINDNMTEISIKTDVYQTWQFDIDIMTSYVEREHVNDDSVGANTFPEGLETGEYIIDDFQYIGDFSKTGSDVPGRVDPGYYTVFSTSWDPFDTYNSSTQKYEGKEATGEYGGVSTGAIYIAMEDFNSIERFLNAMAYQGRNDAIVGAFVVPRSLIYSGDYIPFNWWTKIKYGDGTFSYTYGYHYVPSYRISTMRTAEIYPPTQLATYNPVNNKLKCYPYSYLEVNNNGGTAVIYRYEDFDLSAEAGNGKMLFVEKGVPTPGCSIKLIPEYYRHVEENYEESVNLCKLPICAYAVDMYTNWLTQNSLSIGLSLTEQAFSIGENLMTGNVSGAIHGAFGIGQTMAEKEKHKMIPPQVQGDTNNGDVSFGGYKSVFTVYKKCIKPEYAAKIDNYFTMFGYRVNITKVPNVFGRTYFNYVKTIDANIEGYIPQTDLQEIKDMFNNGITFWHDPSHFLDYSVNNSIVS